MPDRLDTAVATVDIPEFLIAAGARDQADCSLTRRAGSKNNPGGHASADSMAAAVRCEQLVRRPDTR
jgi:hypothetical protein